MNSIQFEIPSLTYKDSYFIAKYPYSWAKDEGFFIPTGYNQSNVISSLALYSPINGPYYFFKAYRLYFDYDYSYKTEENPCRMSSNIEPTQDTPIGQRLSQKDQW
jgi:hypothetical protein